MGTLSFVDASVDGSTACGVGSGIGEGIEPVGKGIPHGSGGGGMIIVWPPLPSGTSCALGGSCDRGGRGAPAGIGTAIAGGGQGIPPGICICEPIGINGNGMLGGKGWLADGGTWEVEGLAALGEVVSSIGDIEVAAPGVEGGIEASVEAERIVSALDELRVCLSLFEVDLGLEGPANGGIGN